MSQMSVRISDYHSENDAIHCVLCEKDDMVGVTVSFDGGFLTDSKLCLDCLKEVLAFKDRVTSPGGNEPAAIAPSASEPAVMPPPAPVDEPMDFEDSEDSYDEPPAPPMAAPIPVPSAEPVAESPEPAILDEAPEDEFGEPDDLDFGEPAATGFGPPVDSAPPEPPEMSFDDIDLDEPERSELDAL